MYIDDMIEMLLSERSCPLILHIHLRSFSFDLSIGSQIGAVVVGGDLHSWSGACTLYSRHGSSYSLHVLAMKAVSTFSDSSSANS